MCDGQARGQRVKLGFKVHILRFVYAVRSFCFARWDILGHRIDQGMVGIRGLDRGHIDVQHILMPTQLKNNSRKCPLIVTTPHSCGITANNKPQLTNFMGFYKELFDTLSFGLLGIHFRINPPCRLLV